MHLFKSASFLLTVFSATLHAAIIGDTVWIDLNRNGIRDKDDPAKAEISLKLYFDKNGDGFPERLIARTKSDAEGHYAFEATKPGLYLVGLEVKSLPDEIYEATRLHVGAPDRDNDLNRNSIRTAPIAVKADSGDLTNVADIGLVIGSTKVEYLRQEKYVSLTGLQVDCDIYLYKGLKLRFPAHHGRLKPAVIKRQRPRIRLRERRRQRNRAPE
jgi:hypothetical protein